MADEAETEAADRVRCAHCGEQIDGRPVSIVILVRGEDRRVAAHPEHAGLVAFGPQLTDAAAHAAPADTRPEQP